MNTQAFFIPDEPVYQSFVLLAGPILAIQILPKENGRITLGLLSQLPAGAVLRICGDGFDERTVQVSVNDHFYFVFRQEIDRANGMCQSAAPLLS
jgi:hypothetical protein